MSRCVVDGERLSHSTLEIVSTASANVEHAVASTMLRVLCSVPIQMIRGLDERPSDKSKVQVSSSSPGLHAHWAVHSSANTITRVSDPIPTVTPKDHNRFRCHGRCIPRLLLAGTSQASSGSVSQHSNSYIYTQTGIACAGGAITDGGWGLEKTCYRCNWCYE